MTLQQLIIRESKLQKQIQQSADARQTQQLEQYRQSYSELHQLLRALETIYEDGMHLQPTEYEQIKFQINESDNPESTLGALDEMLAEALKRNEELAGRLTGAGRSADPLVQLTQSFLEQIRPVQAFVAFWEKLSEQLIQRLLLVQALGADSEQF